MKRHRKALVIGAGSGRDIASAVLLTEGIRKQGTEVDLAGFLTPWAWHRFNGRLERPVNRLVEDTEKFIPAEGPETLDSYFEPLLLKLNRELDLGIGGFFLFSLQHGTAELGRQIEGLIAENRYDLVLAADVGGDILARREDIPTLLTPIVDLTCLEILSGIRTEADRLLAVIAPGVDGEIPRKRLVEILKDLEDRGVALERLRIAARSEEYRRFVEVNEQIDRRTTATSRTFRTIRRMIEGDIGPYALETYFKKVVQGGKEKLVPFEVELELGLVSSIRLFGLEGVREASGIGTLRYRDIREAYLVLKGMGATATEVDRILARS
jgi:hypothetical protein